MLRLPKPRPFIRPDRQRPKLANALMLAIFSPYMVFLAFAVVGGLCAILWFTLQALGGA